jgi:two-component system, chemotaxis family, response regulator Rcp1
MSAQTAGRPVEILLVEDNPGDIRLTVEVLKEADDVHTNLSVVKDGIEAMAFLRREGHYTDAPRPDLILLDLNLPKKDGLELLSDMNRDQNLKDIRVVILTTSEAEKDIHKSFDLDASSYIIKPIDVDRLMMVLKPTESA